MNKDLKELLKYFIVIICIWLSPLIIGNILDIFHDIFLPDNEFFMGEYVCIILLLIIPIIIIFYTIIMFKKAKSKPLRAFFDNMGLSTIIFFAMIASYCFAKTFSNMVFVESSIIPVVSIILCSVFFAIVIFAIFIRKIIPTMLFAFIAILLFAITPIVFIFNSYNGIVLYAFYYAMVVYCSIYITILFNHFFKFIKAKLINCIKK